MVAYVPVVINRSTPDDGLGDDAFDWAGKTNDNMAALFGGITITDVTFEWNIADLTVNKLKVLGDTEIEGSKGTEVVIKIIDDGSSFTPGESTGKFSVFSADISGAGASNAGEIDIVYNESSGTDYDMIFRVRNASGTNEVLKLEGNTKKAFFASDITVADDLTITDGNQLITNTANEITFRIDQKNASFANAVAFLNSDRAANSAYNFVVCRSDASGTPDVEYKSTGIGDVFCDGSFTGGGADLREQWEWSPSWIVLWMAENPLKDPLTELFGISVKLDGEFIIPADESNEDIIGVTSNTGGLSMNNPLNFPSKYKSSDLGVYDYESYTHLQWIEILEPEILQEINKDGEVIIAGKEAVTKKHSYHLDRVPKDIKVPDDSSEITMDEDGNALTRKILNPKFDPKTHGEYIERVDRAEWIYVGYTGRVRILNGQPLHPRWKFVKRISDKVNEYLV